MFRSLAIAAPLIACTLSGAAAAERELYFTDFEDATPGIGNLVDYDNWVGSSTGGNWQAINDEAVQGLGNSASIGFGSPSRLTTNLVSVARLLAHDPTTSSEPIVRLVADLGGFAISWERGGTLWGNNWMLLDDWTISADTIKLVIPESPFKIADIDHAPSGDPRINWFGQPGFTYQIEYSDNGSVWLSDLPASSITPTAEADTEYVDTSATGNPSRIYRITRTTTE